MKNRIASGVPLLLLALAVIVICAYVALSQPNLDPAPSWVFVTMIVGALVVTVLYATGFWLILGSPVGG